MCGCVCVALPTAPLNSVAQLFSMQGRRCWQCLKLHNFFEWDLQFTDGMEKEAALHDVPVEVNSSRNITKLAGRKFI